MKNGAIRLIYSLYKGIKVFHEKWGKGRVAKVRTSDVRRYHWIYRARYRNEMTDGSYELDVLFALKNILRCGDTFFDIDAKQVIGA